MQSKDVDCFLRLENADGKQLGSTTTAAAFRTLGSCKKSMFPAKYTIVATCYDDKTDKTDKTAKVRQDRQVQADIGLAEPRDILLAKVRTSPCCRRRTGRACLPRSRKNLPRIRERLIGDWRILFLTSPSTWNSLASVTRPLRFYTDFGKILAAASNPEVGKMGKTMEGALRRARLVGNAIRRPRSNPGR